MSKKERGMLLRVAEDKKELHLNLGPIDGMECCDFCNGFDVVHGFECPTFSIERKVPPDGKTLMLGSNGDWAACSVCRELIFAEKPEELLARSWELSEDRHLVPKEFLDSLYGVMCELHKNFWSKKTGKHYAFTPTVN